VWDAETFEPVTPPLKHGPELSDARLSKDGKAALTVAGREIKVWTVGGGRERFALRLGERVRSAEFSPDGTRILTACADDSARLWNAADGAAVSVIRHPAPVHLAAWSPDGSRILTAARGPGVDEEHYGFKAAVYVWDAGGGKQLLRRGLDDSPNGAKDAGLRPAAWSGDGKRIAVVVFKGVTVWDVQSGDGIASPTTWGDLAHRNVGPTTGLVLNHDGTVLATYNQGGAAVWDTTKNDRLIDTFADGEPVRDVVFAPTGRRFLLSVAGGSNRTGVWDAGTRRQVLGLRAEGDNVRAAPALAWSSDGRRVAAGFASDGYTAVWDVPEGKRP
jgi:WD40 repeat protein